MKQHGLLTEKSNHIASYLMDLKERCGATYDTMSERMEVDKSFFKEIENKTDAEITVREFCKYLDSMGYISMMDISHENGSENLGGKFYVSGVFLVE